MDVFGIFTFGVSCTLSRMTLKMRLKLKVVQHLKNVPLDVACSPICLPCLNAKRHGFVTRNVLVKFFFSLIATLYYTATLTAIDCRVRLLSVSRITPRSLSSCDEIIFNSNQYTFLFICRDHSYFVAAVVML